MLKIKINVLNSGAKVPSYAHIGDAGMDLYSYSEEILKPGDRFKVNTGIAMEIPEGFVGLIWDKSGVAMNSGIKVIGGVVDCGYRGEIIVGVINLSKEDFIIKQGQKIAQMIIQRKEEVEIEEVQKLTDTSRGEDGFGSTGI